MRHISSALLSLLLGLTTALVGCSDYNLRVLPAATGPASIARIPTGGGGGVTPPGGSGGGGGPASPWANLSPSELPEEYFALAWNDPRTGCHDCFVPVYDRPRYDIIDVQGRVVVSFELPWTSYVEHLSMTTAGPGRFLAVSSTWSTGEEFPWKAWYGDGVSGEIEVALEWGWNGHVYLPLADRNIHLSEWLGDAHVMPDPTNPDRIYVLPQNTNMYANPLLGTLYSIDVRDPEAPVVTWSPEDMVGEELIPEWGWAPWAPWKAEAYLDGDRAVIVLGLEVFDENGMPRRILKNFSPQIGPLGWEMDLTGVTQQTELVLQPSLDEGPARILFNSEPSWCSGATFARFDGIETESITGSTEVWCTRLGPVLDEEGRTFLYHGAELNPEFEVEERLLISHEGADVWQYTRIRDGLSTLPFVLHDLVRLSPLEN